MVPYIEREKVLGLLDFAINEENQAHKGEESKAAASGVKMACQSYAAALLTSLRCIAAAFPEKYIPEPQNITHGDLTVVRKTTGEEV
jgi:hypothetical protein